MAKKMTEAAKKAMAQRGTFEAMPSGGVTYSAKVIAATAPFIRRERWMTREWGTYLLKLVPPAWAAKYQEQVDALHDAMEQDDVSACVSLAESLSKAIEVMDARARQDGHTAAPDRVLTHIHDGKVFTIIGGGDISIYRREHPDQIVYSIEEAVLALAALSKATSAITDAFPSAKVTRISGRQDMDDEFDL